MAARLTGGRGRRRLTMALGAPVGGAAGISTRSVERRDMTQQSAAASGARRHASEADGLERTARRRRRSAWLSLGQAQGGGGGLLESSGVVMNFFRQKAAATKLRPWVYHVSFSNSILTVWEYLLFNHELNATSQYRTTDFADHGSTTHRSHFDHTGQLVCYYVLLY
jgi:hypothetical protein